MMQWKVQLLMPLIDSQTNEMFDVEKKEKKCSDAFGIQPSAKDIEYLIGSYAVKIFIEKT